MKNKFMYLLFVFINISCNVFQDNNKECKYVSMERLFTDEQNGGNGISYAHYLFINKFDKECLDSSTICKIALSYVDTVKDYKPISAVKFYNSLKKYNSEGEKSQDMSFDDDCLVEIFFNINTGKIKTFGFYDDKGENFQESESFPKWRNKQ